MLKPGSQSKSLPYLLLTVLNVHLDLWDDSGRGSCNYYIIFLFPFYNVNFFLTSPWGAEVSDS